jgi:cell division protein ZapA (FtsZ GTPase activity inhibitor)
MLHIFCDDVHCLGESSNEKNSLAKLIILQTILVLKCLGLTMRKKKRVHLKRQLMDLNYMMKAKGFKVKESVKKTQLETLKLKNRRCLTNLIIVICHKYDHSTPF